MAAASTTTFVSRFISAKGVAFSAYAVVRMEAALLLGLLAAPRHRSRRVDVYNILWAVVFGFATLNILSLAARRFEPQRRGLTFGELMAVLVVVLSIFLLGWELLNFVHIFPIKLKR